MKRMRLTLGKKVGLRMGYGVRDEYHETRIHLVTTGYLAKFATHNPGNFHNHTHLIIDEVHERGIQSDLMCLLAKKLLDKHYQLKLILMSATLQTDLYQTYFTEYSSGGMDGEGVSQLSVGVKRFHIQIKYLDDLPQRYWRLVKQSSIKKTGPLVREQRESLLFLPTKFSFCISFIYSY